MLLESDGKVSPGRARQVWELVQGPWDIKRECSHRAAPGDKIGAERSTKQDRLLTRTQKTKEERNEGSQLKRETGLYISSM